MAEDLEREKERQRSDTSGKVKDLQAREWSIQAREQDTKRLMEV